MFVIFISLFISIMAVMAVGLTMFLSVAFNPDPALMPQQNRQHQWSDEAIVSPKETIVVDSPIPSETFVCPA